MKLLLDENIPDELADRLIESGFDIHTAPSGASDREAASLAKRGRRILVTQDKDLSNILLFPPEEFHGIIRIKIHPPTISDIFNALEDLLSKFSQKDLDKKLVILEKDGFRFR